MPDDFDIITVGGGLGGAALAKAMAERGYRVLVVEREKRFKDRVRGEWLAPLGVAETKDLGIYDLLMQSCSYHPVWWDTRIGPASLGDRDLAETTPGGCHSMTFYHPQMQETLIAAAEEAGAEVRRGVRVKGIETGEDRSVHLEWGGGSETPSTRLIVGVDGRGSLVRKWTGFQVSQVRELNQLCGVLFEDIPVPQDRSVLVLNPFLQRLAIIFPQGGARARVYLASRVDEGMRLQGDKDVPRFIEESVKTGVDPSYFEGAHAAGPLATFPGVYEWVEHPYKDGAALIGDAACTSDPTWGQGLSLTVRDARVLRDKLLADDDWDAAGHKYADEHDWHFNAVRTVEDWWTQLFYDPGPEAGARRGRVLADIENPDRLPDMFQLGPDHVVADEAARLRMFGDD